jgi:hypothetical protein
LAYLVTHESTRTFTPKSASRGIRKKRNFSLETCTAKVSCWNHFTPGGDQGSASLCRPRFSFFNIQFSKNRHRNRNVDGPGQFGLAHVSVARAALVISFNQGCLEANCLLASGAPPSLLSGLYAGPRARVNSHFASLSHIILPALDKSPNTLPNIKRIGLDPRKSRPIKVNCEILAAGIPIDSVRLDARHSYI